MLFFGSGGWGREPVVPGAVGARAPGAKRCGGGLVGQSAPSRTVRGLSERERAHQRQRRLGRVGDWGQPANHELPVT